VGTGREHEWKNTPVSRAVLTARVQARVNLPLILADQYVSEWTLPLNLTPSTKSA